MSARFKLLFCPTYIFVDPFHYFYSKCIFCFLLLLFCLFAVIRKFKYLFRFILEAGRIILLKVVFAKLVKMFGWPTFKIMSETLDYLALTCTCVDDYPYPFFICWS